MHKFYNFFFKNLGVKLLCVLLAVGLWVYVGSGETRNANFPGGVPLQIKNVPQGLVAVTDTETIDVKVMATNDVFQKLTADSFVAYVDLAGYKEGTYNIKPVVTVNVANVAVVQTDPSQVVISLEPSISKDVPVSPQISGSAGTGLVAGQATTDPAKVNVSGARSVVNSIMSATAKVQLSGQTSDFKQMTAVVALDAKGKEIKNLTFTPAQVIVSVPIVKASNVKTVGIKVNTTGNVAQGFWISEITTDPKTVTVTGAEEMISKLSYIPTADVSIDGLNKNTTLTTTLAPPAGVNVLDNIPKVTVNLSIAKNQSSKTLSAGFTWQGLAQNLKVTSADPTTVQVVVSGPQDILSSLNSGDISIIVDLSGYSLPGTYSVDISRANISGPAGVSVSSIVPSAINVRLDTK